jgi:hypothetical protein
MSWRALIVFLLLAALASWQGGVQLGEWLVARAPESVSASSRPKESQDQLLDANGKPFTAQPPQPRVDGTLGSPRERTAIDWKITPTLATQFSEDHTAMKVDAEGHVIIDGSEGGYERRDHELSAGGKGLPSGQNDIATLDIANPRQDSPAGGARTYPTTGGNSANATPPFASQQPRSAQLTWQQKLKSELDQCASQGFFQRPTCIQNARNRHCGPNNAWGKNPDCPARSSDSTIGG